MATELIFARESCEGPCYEQVGAASLWLGNSVLQHSMILSPEGVMFPNCIWAKIGKDHRSDLCEKLTSQQP